MARQGTRESGSGREDSAAAACSAGGAAAAGGEDALRGGDTAEVFAAGVFPDQDAVTPGRGMGAGFSRVEGDHAHRNAKAGRRGAGQHRVTGGVTDAAPHKPLQIHVTQHAECPGG